MVNKFNNYFEIVSKSPFSPNSIDERKSLLLFSCIGIFLYKFGLLPSKISWAGIELSYSNQESIKYILSLIIIYFLSNFLIKGSFEFINWALILFSQSPYENSKNHTNKNPEEILSNIKESKRLLVKITSNKYRSFLFLLRITIEFFLPLFFSLYALWSIIFFSKTP